MGLIAYRNEYSGDYNELLYLRARFYSPELGRFTTKDSWQGEYGRPLSLNRWNYVEGNPVNFTDPSGRWIHPRCQWLPTKALYELCILQKYGLEPISYTQLGLRVQGQRGCYSGPSEYRAPGYIEGIEAHFGGLPSYTTGIEVVYDFATMQRASFKFQGGTINDGLLGAGGSAYFGKALGLRSDTDLIQDYKDVSFSGSVGMSLDIVLGGAIGRGGFVAAASNTIPVLRGKTWYIGLSVSGDMVEGLDLSGSWVTYSPISLQVTPYARADGTVDSARLYTDLLSGAGSPWGQLQVNLSNSGLTVTMGAVRTYGLYLAHKYILAYEELHNANP